MPRLIILILAFVILHSPVVFSEPIAATEKHEAAGLGIGALIGGLVAGPPGAIIGATGGLFYGNHVANRNIEKSELERELQEKTTAISALQQQLAIQNSIKNNFHPVANSQDSTKPIQNLANGFIFSIYFRTGKATPENSLIQPVTEIAQLVRDVPSIMIELDAHADRRGNDSCNLALSRDRANSVREMLIRTGLPEKRIVINANGESRAKAGPGDIEGLIFDRRVDVRLTLDNQA